MRARKTEASAEKKTRQKAAPKQKQSVSDPIQMRREVELKAYYNFLNRQSLNRSGNDISDWLEAEKDVYSHQKPGL